MKTGEPVESLSLSKILVLYMRKYLFTYNMTCVACHSTIQKDHANDSLIDDISNLMVNLSCSLIDFEGRKYSYSDERKSQGTSSGKTPGCCC